MEISEIIKQGILEFVSKPGFKGFNEYQRSTYYSDSKMRVYLKRRILFDYNKYGTREGKYREIALEISNILVFPKYQNKGLFKSFLNYCIENVPHSLMVSEIHNEIITSYLEYKPGWVVTLENIDTICTAAEGTDLSAGFPSCGNAYAYYYK